MGDGDGRSSGCSGARLMGRKPSSLMRSRYCAARAREPGLTPARSHAAVRVRDVSRAIARAARTMLVCGNGPLLCRRRCSAATSSSSELVMAPGAEDPERSVGSAESVPCVRSSCAACSEVFCFFARKFAKKISSHPDRYRVVGDSISSRQGQISLMESSSPLRARS
jgi:hypothetical protein